MHQAAVDIMPVGHPDDLDMDTVAQKMEKLLGDDRILAMGGGLERQLKSVASFLRNLVKAIPPKGVGDAANGELFNDIVRLSENWLRSEVTVQTSPSKKPVAEKKNVVYGAAAIDSLWVPFKEAILKNGVRDMAALDSFRRFQWLLRPLDQQLLDEWVQEGIANHRLVTLKPLSILDGATASGSLQHMPL